MTQQLTTTNATPIRIDATHYRIESQSKDRIGRAYDLVFNAEQRRWICNCPDTRHNQNPRCKHVRRLAAWINEQEEAEGRIQAQAAAIIEQEFGQVTEPEYREYGPALPEPKYFTELDERLAKLEGRMQANECEIAILDDQLGELRKALAEEREAREKLEAELLSEIHGLRAALQAAQVELGKGIKEAWDYTDGMRQVMNDRMRTRKAEIAELRTQVAELEVLRTEMQSLREELTNKIDAAFHVAQNYANGLRKHNNERYHKQREEIEALQAQVIELEKREPVRIEAQVVAVTSKNGTKRVDASVSAKPEAQPQINEIEREGKLIGLEIDGYQIKIAHGMVMACPCPEGQNTYCKHCKQGEAHLEAKKRGNAQLGSNKPFSLTR